LPLVLLLAGALQAGTLFPYPAIVVSPTTIKFGAADPHRTFTNTFLVENAGGGKLVGKATVEPPFKIIDGGSYVLRENEAQVVTIIYVPKGSASVTNTVKFTGAGGAKATAIGRPLKPL